MSKYQIPTVLAGKPIGPIGFGMMSLTKPAKNISYEEGAKVLKAALERGANFWNGGKHYGTPEYNSLHLLKYYFTKYPEDADKVILCIKSAYEPISKQATGSPEEIRASVDACLRILDGTKTIDIFEMARVDPRVPIETSIQTLADLVKEGKIGGVGLSEVNSNTIRRAASVTKIESAEIELSIFTPDPLHNGIMEACHELDIAVIAYSPLGSGWLTGAIQKPDDFDANMVRVRPRFSAEVFDQNLKLAKAVEQLAQRKQVTPAQVAVAWVRQQGAFPLPGASTAERVHENCQAVELSEEDLAEIQGLMEAFPVAGDRYGPGFQDSINL